MSSDPILLRAYRGEKTERPPVWFMRQAGRYLPEYREIRSKHPMLEVIRSPKLASEVTLQPLERFDLDGAIIFADILNILIGMGIELDFVAGEGPRIFNPIKTHADVEALQVPPAATNVGYTLEAIDLVCSKLASRGIPLLGFAGAPFTLACYMVEGGKGPLFLGARRMMIEQPASWALLLDKLSQLTIDYLVAQIKAGASAVQIFDSWVGLLGRFEFEKSVYPYVRDIIAQVKAQTGAPVCYFSTASLHLFPSFKELGADVIGVDWRVSLPQALSALESNVALQGNLDPIYLTGEGKGLEEAVRRVLQEGARIGPHIFNVGHGLGPETNPDLVQRTIELVR